MARDTKKEHHEAIVAFLIERDGDICSVCWIILDETVSIDHIVQVSEGGTHRLANFRAVHRKCNYLRKKRRYVRRKPYTKPYVQNPNAVAQRRWREKNPERAKELQDNKRKGS